jgi:hypothetical protein
MHVTNFIDWITKYSSVLPRSNVDLPLECVDKLTLGPALEFCKSRRNAISAHHFGHVSAFLSGISVKHTLYRHASESFQQLRATVLGKTEPLKSTK